MKQFLSNGGKMDLLVDKHLTITKEQSKTHISIPVEVEQHYHELIIKYEYSPKVTEDKALCKKYIVEALKKYQMENESWEKFYPINNLITVSLDDENGHYLGAAHNQSCKNVYTINAQQSSYGFIPKTIVPGIYHCFKCSYCTTRECEISLTGFRRIDG